MVNETMEMKKGFTMAVVGDRNTSLLTGLTGSRRSNGGNG